MNQVQDRLMEALEQRGCRARIVPIERFKDLQAEMERLCRDGTLGKVFCDRYMHWLSYEDAQRLPGAKSVIIAAMPQPIFRLTFRRNGRDHAVTLPPTYAGRDDDEKLQELVEGVLREDGLSILKVHPPLKLLAVHSGLSRYGRNNVSYVEGMGSFNRLVAWVSNMEAAGDPWGEAVRMPECDHCQQCVKACPTGCIDPDKKLVNACNCLTHMNESSEPIPEWVDPSWHNALVGCMACQLACPANRAFLEPEPWEDAFDEDETALLLSGVPLGSLPERTREALKRLDLTGYCEDNALSRNLKLLLDRA